MKKGKGIPGWAGCRVLGWAGVAGGSGSLAAQLTALVSEAQSAGGKREQILERFARW
jgi:hypothetical protein